MPDPESRLTRVEENQAFAERACEQLAEQLRELFDRLGALSRRIAALEQRLARSEPMDSENGAWPPDESAP